LYLRSARRPLRQTVDVIAPLAMTFVMPAAERALALFAFTEFRAS